MGVGLQGLGCAYRGKVKLQGYGERSVRAKNQEADEISGSRAAVGNAEKQMTKTELVGHAKPVCKPRRDEHRHTKADTRTGTRRQTCTGRCVLATLGILISGWLNRFNRVVGYIVVSL